MFGKQDRSTSSGLILKQYNFGLYYIQFRPTCTMLPVFPWTHLHDRNIAWLVPSRTPYKMSRGIIKYCPPDSFNRHAILYLSWGKEFWNLITLCMHVQVPKHFVCCVTKFNRKLKQNKRETLADNLIVFHSLNSKFIKEFLK